MSWGQPLEQSGYVKWDKPKAIVGKYLRSEEKIGTNNKPYSVHYLDCDGEEARVSGTTILNDLLSQIEPGTLVRIEYTGDRAVPSGRIKDFVVQPWIEE